MSEFGVFIEEIESVKTHPNADRLDLATLKDKFFQFVTGKDLYRQKELVLYFPVDSLIPEKYHALLGVEGKLSGSKKERVKTVRLRGEYSQGLVAPISILDSVDWHDFAQSNGFGSVADALDLNAFAQACVALKVDLSSLFGVVKYEPPVSISGGVNLSGRNMNLPEGISKYDIESAQRYKKVIDELIENKTTIRVTEKLEGTHATFKKVAHEDKFNICSRTRSWERMYSENGDPLKNTYLDMFDQNEKIKSLLLKIEEDYQPKEYCALRGEIVGESIQKNIYHIRGTRFYLFDILVDRQYLSEKELDKYSEMIDRVPILFTGTLQEFLNQSGKENVVQAANGKTVLDCPKNGQQLREGIVIKPFEEEMRNEHLGRVILKVRDLEYLEKSGN